MRKHNTISNRVPLSSCPTTIVQINIIVDTNSAKLMKTICTAYPLANFGASTTDNRQYNYIV